MKTLKQEFQYLVIGILSVIGLITIIYQGYEKIKNFSENYITQKVEMVTDNQKYQLIMDWELSHGLDVLIDKPLAKNPYAGKGYLYKLTTKVNDVSTIDYGTEAEICKLKCIRYSKAKADILVLERLNKQTCK